MKTVLSLPRESIPYFRSLYSSSSYLVGHDPDSRRVGSGGGLIHLLDELSLIDTEERVIFINAGGESRRLPAYAGYGKVLLPLPILKGSRGQRVDRRLFDLQQQTLSRIIDLAPPSLRVVVASGDCYIHLPEDLPPIPQADIVCLGMHGSPQTAMRHGVFVCNKDDPTHLEYMLQKPSLEVLASVSSDYNLFIDSGVWLLSSGALRCLVEECRNTPDGYFDLYGDWGRCLGSTPRRESPSCKGLSVRVWIPQGASFYHFGSSSDLVSSMYALQNLRQRQREGISVHTWKQHRSVFALNSQVDLTIREEHKNIWIENSFIPPSWQIHSEHILTGIPPQVKEVILPSGVCVDVQPRKGETGYILRVYAYTDTFRGEVSDPSTLFLGKPVAEYLCKQGISVTQGDIYHVPLYPVLKDTDDLIEALRDITLGCSISVPVLAWLSPAQAMAEGDLSESEKQRKSLLIKNIQQMRLHPLKSVFFDSDLYRVGEILRSANISPSDLTAVEGLSFRERMQDEMLKSTLTPENKKESLYWTDCARHSLLKWIEQERTPVPSTLTPSLHSDQIVWGRSPVRIDVAGGWTDTPPYCLLEGGCVVNISFLINGQEPIQVYIKRSPHPFLTLHSIDLGVSERIDNISALQDFRCVGSPFSIPKAALSLVGVSGIFSSSSSWEEGIERIGGGIEITLMSALPAGSGLGVSSILAATVLSALSTYFDLHWTPREVGRRTMLLEQLLTTGGGWQDQYGALYGGAKLLVSRPNQVQDPDVTWLPETILTDPLYAPCHLLYYTGQTRVAKHILEGIVHRMCLQEHATLSLLRDIRRNAEEMATAFSRLDFRSYGEGVRRSCALNCKLDSGTLTPEIERMIREVEDLTLGYKLPGAGGGGFLYLVAKDPAAAMRIRAKLTSLGSTLSASSRWVEASLAPKGITVTKS